MLSSRGAQKGYRIINSRVPRLTWLHLSSPGLSLLGDLSPRRNHPVGPRAASARSSTVVRAGAEMG
jgi:hypothetical protein